MQVDITMVNRIAMSRPMKRQMVMAPAASGIPKSMEEEDIGKGAFSDKDFVKETDNCVRIKNVKRMLTTNKRFLLCLEVRRSRLLT